MTPGPQEPEPLEEAVEGAWTGALLLMLTAAGFVAAVVVFPPAKLFGSYRVILPPDTLSTAAILRIAAFLLVALASTATLAWRRREHRRLERERGKRSGHAARLVAARAGDCPFCHDAVAPDDLGQGVVRCPACEVAHHAACWREHEGCSTHGCRRDPRQRDDLRARAVGPG